MERGPPTERTAGERPKASSERQYIPFGMDPGKRSDSQSDSAPETAPRLDRWRTVPGGDRPRGAVPPHRRGRGRPLHLRHRRRGRDRRRPRSRDRVADGPRRLGEPGGPGLARARLRTMSCGGRAGLRAEFKSRLREPSSRVVFESRVRGSSSRAVSESRRCGLSRKSVRIHAPSVLRRRRVGDGPRPVRATDREHS